jgi:hypothetical protein
MLRRVRCWLFAVACCGAAPPDPHPARPSVAPTEASSQSTHLRAVARRYRALRWRKLDEWGSEKHRIMTELGALLGAGSYEVSALRRYMGAPDHVARKGSTAWTFAMPQNENTTAIWVYEWRGMHDFLFFETDGKKVLRSDFFFAGE